MGSDAAGDDAAAADATSLFPSSSLDLSTA
jgi:hypothetical protein